MQREKNITLFVKLGFGEIYVSSVRTMVRQFRMVLLIFGIMTALWVFLLLAAVFYPRPEADWYKIMRQPSAFPWLIAGACVVIFILPVLTAWKLTQDTRIRGGCHYSFSDSGMEFENSSTRATVKWTGFFRAEESDTSFLLFTNKIAAHILPKRCFADDSDISSLRELLRTNVPKSKLKGG